MKSNHVYAIIVAGGTGSRMGNTIPKQLLPLGDKTVLWHSIKAFVDMSLDIEIIVAMHPDFLQLESEYQASFPHSTIRFIAGGDTRFHSTKNGLSLCPQDGIVLVHDAARPLLSTNLVFRLIHATELYGSAIPYIPIKDSLRKLAEDGHSQVVTRDRMVAIQTPQSFRLKDIQVAFEVEYRNEFTDEASVLEALGHVPHLINGEETNIKITTPHDLEFAEWRLSTL